MRLCCKFDGPKEKQANKGKDLPWEKWFEYLAEKFIISLSSRKLASCCAKDLTWRRFYLFMPREDWNGGLAAEARAPKESKMAESGTGEVDAETFNLKIIDEKRIETVRVFVSLKILYLSLLSIPLYLSLLSVPYKFRKVSRMFWTCLDLNLTSRSVVVLL